MKKAEIEQIEKMAREIEPLIASEIYLKKVNYRTIELRYKYNSMGWGADFKKIAEKLVKVGYDNVTMAVKQAFEKLRKKVNSRQVANGYWDKQTIGFEIDEILKEYRK